MPRCNSMRMMKSKIYSGSVARNNRDGSAVKKAGFKNVADICKERIRRAGVKILRECHADWERDAGFRVLRVDTSNVKDVYYTPDQTNQKAFLRPSTTSNPTGILKTCFFRFLSMGVD